MTEQAIELLGWMPISERLKATLERTFAGVASAGRDEATLEHLLAALLEDVDANVYLAGCGVDRDKIREHCLAAVGEAAAPALATGRNGAAPQAVETRRNGFGGEDDEAAPIGGDAYFFSRSSRSAAAGEEHARPIAYHDGYAGGSNYAASATRRSRATPSRAVRRLMARASEMAERSGSDVVGGELVAQAVALDGGTETGRLLQRLLPGRELAKLRAVHEPERRAAEECAAEAKRKKTTPPKEAAFEALVKRVEELLHTLHRELQKDVRYRIANDLSAFLSNRQGDAGGYAGGELKNSALPILHATRAELDRDPQFRALERMRVALRAIRGEESEVRRALAELMRHGLLEQEGALTKAVRALVKLPAPQAAEADRSEATLSAAAVDPAEAVETASPETVTIPAPLPAPAPAEAVEATPSATPILNRVLGSVRPASQMFSRRRSGPAGPAEANQA